MKEIKLTQGKVALVDDEDYEWLSQFKWYADSIKGIFYAKTAIKGGKYIKMHRLIMNNPDSNIDHVDRNGLNNQRNNLRPCNQSENGMNRTPLTGCSSKYKGVSLIKTTGIWRSGIKINQKRIHIGCYRSEIEAAKSYDAKAKELFGEFACLNFKL